MTEQTILTWNATNWVTILLMVGIGGLILKVASSWLGKKASA